MMTFTELQKKEVVMMHSGEKLGIVDDLEIDEVEGLITSIIIMNHAMKGSFFQKPEEIIIPWTKIVTIGSDIILIDQENNSSTSEENDEKTTATDEDFIKYDKI